MNKLFCKKLKFNNNFETSNYEKNRMLAVTTL